MMMTQALLNTIVRLLECRMGEEGSHKVKYFTRWETHVELATQWQSKSQMG